MGCKYVARHQVAKRRKRHNKQHGNIKINNKSTYENQYWKTERKTKDQKQVVSQDLCVRQQQDEPRKR